jgi:pyruvate,water dikinase
MTCHGAIVARELGIPAVVGVSQATQRIQTGDRIQIDGSRGRIYWEVAVESETVASGEGAIATELSYSSTAAPQSQSVDAMSNPSYAANRDPKNQAHRAKQSEQLAQSGQSGQLDQLDQPDQSDQLDPLNQPEQSKQSEQSAPSASGLESQEAQRQAWIASPTTPTLEFPRIPTATHLWVNLSQVNSLEHVQSLPLDGVGLLRSELMLLDTLNGQHPQAWIQDHQPEQFVQRLADSVAQFAQAFYPRPVFYRSLDWRPHEVEASGSSRLLDRNPVLGVRGAFSYQINPKLFDLELAALQQLRQQGEANVHLLLPFVRTVEEFRFCRQRIEQSGLMDDPHFQLWIMAEVPSVMFLVADFVRAGVQGISIGTNDLTQLILGIDRDHPQLAQVYDERHPAVMAAIAHLIQAARQHQIPCSICGQAPARHPDLIETLIRWRITSISVELDAVEATYWEIVRAEKRLLLEQINDSGKG